MARKKTTSRKTKKRRNQARRKTTRGGTSSRKRPSRRKKSTRRSKKNSFSLNLPQKMLIGGLGTIFITLILILSLLSPNQGQLTAALSGLMWRTFGWGGLIVPLITGGVGLYLVLWGMDQAPELPVYRLIGFGLSFLTFTAFASLIMLLLDNGYFDVWSLARAQTGGGYLGGLLTYALTEAVGTLGAVFTLMVVGIIAAFLLTGVTRAQLAEFVQDVRNGRYTPDLSRSDDSERAIPLNPGRAGRRNANGDSPAQLALNLDEKAPPEPATEPVARDSEKKKSTRPSRRSRRVPAPDPAPESAPTVATPVIMGNMSRRRGRAPSWQLPGVADILEPGSEQDTNNVTIREQVEIIEHTLESFGAPATVVEINQGPTITQYGVEPAFIERRNGSRTKVKVGKIAGLADDLALALAAHSIRIQAPVPGKGYVGIEVPNPAKALVSLHDVIESSDYQRIKSKLRIGLGQNVAGQAITADLTAMPHLLIAGTTGSGKSVCVNSIIACMLLENTPEELKVVMIDPKRVELTGYNGIPHLAAPVVVEMDKVIGTLQWAMREMDGRYKMFADLGARNIIDYNKKVKRRKDVDPLPYIVIIIDELADLMMLAPEDTERAVTRLAQMARATGIHMIIATQRPSVDVVTGLIKANFPARIAFAVASSTDSRVVLDTTGAERLLGQGDMLFQSPDAAAPVRLQGCFVSDVELNRLIGYWQRARRFNTIPAEESVQKREEAAAPSARPVGESSPPPAQDNGGSGNSQPVPPPQVNLGRQAPAADEAPTRVAQPKTAQPKKTQPKGERPNPPPPAKSKADDIPFDADPQDPAAEETAVVEPESTPRAGETTMQQPLWEALQAIEEEDEDAFELDDELLPDAIELVRKLQKASTSLLQRRFRIGYTRAARIIDYMAEKEIIGPPTGTSKAREVLLPPLEEDKETDADN